MNSSPALHRPQQHRLAAKAIATITVMLAAFVYSSSYAQGSNFFSTLQNALQKANPGASGAPGKTAGGPSSGKGGSVTADQWCKEQTGALGSIKADTQIIASEFNVTDLESLQDVFLKAFHRSHISKTFPDARFFQSSFETKKVRAIYDNFLAFPEPDTLAALIQLSRSSDPQERGDGLMALVFLNLQAPELSINKNHWNELYQSAYKISHYTATVFRARLAAYGEAGSKNLNSALGELVSAGRILSEYRNGGNGKEFDIQNYELVKNATTKDIYFNEPNMPNRKMWEGPANMGMKIEAAQKAYADKFPTTRLGKIYKEADRINGESIDIGNKIIQKSQGGNQLSGQLAGLDSLKGSKSGDKQTFVDINPEAQAAQLRMIAKVGTFDDEQKRMMTQAQEKRYTAQGMISQSYSDLMREMMSFIGGDFVKMATPLEALKQANETLIQSCMITAKWDQAMRARDVPPADKNKAAVVATSFTTTGKYKDD